MAIHSGENVVLRTSLALAAEEFRNYAKTDTDLDSIRSDDRFKALVYD
jgi:hypothetical protein